MDAVHVLWGAEHGRSVVTDIASEVRDILVFHLGSEEAKLTDNAKLIEDLGADSLDVVEVVMSFEEKFDIDIPNHVAAELVTVGDAIAFITAEIGRDRPSSWGGPVGRAAAAAPQWLHARR